MKLISFTVPCYNSAAYMKKCVDSLLRVGDEAEIIIVNDGSTDETAAIAEDYAARFPGIVRVCHQENGGHGAGIMSGIRMATGRWFKVVDSDDWLDPKALDTLIARLHDLSEAPDLVVTNYVYWRQGEGAVHTVRYDRVFRDGRVIGWEDTRRFGLTQYLTIHSCIFRTRVLRDANIELPRHIFYEDNLYVSWAVTKVQRILYLDIDLYMYYVGRAGQSVAGENLMRRAGHQVEVAARIFEVTDIGRELRTCPKRGRYLYHAASFFFCIACVFSRMRQTPEADAEIREMWKRVMAKDPVLGRRIRRRSIAMLTDLPGSAGQKLCVFGYKCAHKVINFN
ncbi:MAG: glycosyltransferase family 2 protein [Clostridia bacterium]|nr:glycosyltransferase family 2 protein [Clostridia bacterium]